MEVVSRTLPDSRIAKCERCRVRKASFCRLVEGTDFTELASISHIRSFRAGETIIAQDERSKIAGNVVSGVLKLVKSLSDGRTQIVGLLYPADFFGRLYEGGAGYSVEAAVDVELCCIDRAVFEDFLYRHPAIMQELYVESLGMLDNAHERIMLLACQSTLERLAAYLAMRLLQTERDIKQKQPGQRVVVNSLISRKDFAGYLGTTPETISRNVQYLSRAGIIRILDSEQFEVLKRRQLFELSGQSEEEWAASGVTRADRRSTVARQLEVAARMRKMNPRMLKPV